MRSGSRIYGATEDRLLTAIDRKRAVLAAINGNTANEQDARIALLALESEGVLSYPR